MNFEIYRQKKNGTAFGYWRLKFKDRAGYMCEHSLGTTDEGEARAKAPDLYRMLTAPPAPPAPAPVQGIPAPAAPAALSAQSGASPSPPAPGSVSKVAQAFTRFAPQLGVPVAYAQAAGAALAGTPPAAPAAPDEEPIDPKKQRKLAKLFARMAVRADEVIGGLAIKTFTDRIPDRASKDESEVIGEAIELELEERLASKSINPWWIILGGSAGMWFGMYANGRDKPKKPGELLQLHQGGAGTAGTPGGTDGGAGG